jgi:hypothetical protein
MVLSNILRKLIKYPYFKSANFLHVVNVNLHLEKIPIFKIAATADRRNLIAMVFPL